LGFEAAPPPQGHGGQALGRLKTPSNNKLARVKKIKD
jgi:hypothetical protein